MPSPNAFSPFGHKPTTLEARPRNGKPGQEGPSLPYAEGVGGLQSRSVLSHVMSDLVILVSLSLQQLRG